MDLHLFEDRMLVYAWLACRGEKVEGEFRCRTGKRLRKQNKKKIMKVKKRTDSVSIRFPIFPFFKLDSEGT